MVRSILVLRVVVKPTLASVAQMSRSSSSAVFAALPSRAQLGIQRKATVFDGSITLAMLDTQLMMAGNFKASLE
jgi:hypothetical protein